MFRTLQRLGKRRSTAVLDSAMGWTPLSQSTHRGVRTIKLWKPVAILKYTISLDFLALFRRPNDFANCKKISFLLESALYRKGQKIWPTFKTIFDTLYFKYNIVNVLRTV